MSREVSAEMTLLSLWLGSTMCLAAFGNLDMAVRRKLLLIWWINYTVINNNVLLLL